MQAEEAVKAARFPRAAILQPGMLDRGDLARGVEKAGMKLPFVPSVPVAQVRCGRLRGGMRESSGCIHRLRLALRPTARSPQVARCMVADAERFLTARAGGGGDAAGAAAAAAEPEVKVYSMRELQDYKP